MSFDEIKLISKQKFSLILQKSIQKCGFEYLIKKRGSKGQDIQYTKLKMADYDKGGKKKYFCNKKSNGIDSLKFFCKTKC